MLLGPSPPSPVVHGHTGPCLPIFVSDQAVLLSEELKLDEITAVEYLITAAEEVNRFKYSYLKT